ncbi:class I SAM-dependent methyltransferase [Candidatus Woesearchaeota archaeon]|nr:MAG: class I SAM-dependent methyltransferase [Candidatus Woesearchaeota archaeon]
MTGKEPDASKEKKVSHYYSPEQDSDFVVSSVNAVLRNREFVFSTAPGVFSKSRVDPGTALLVESVDRNWLSGKKKPKILDIGCGYGAVGIALAREFPNAEVVMSDVNRRALKLATINAKQNNVSNVQILESFLYDNIKGKFDLILSNPPQSAGKDVCVGIIRGAHDFLKEGGIFMFVARHKKGGKTLEKEMIDAFGNSSVAARKSGYRVYLAVKKK